MPPKKATKTKKKKKKAAGNNIGVKEEIFLDTRDLLRNMPWGAVLDRYMG